ncbi:MAG: hypothetical protein GY792_30575, partial [Gammaproteobacteria bacterium]|nr:hypothetical protein [Gammaproteobacteria bacterium]
PEARLDQDTLCELADSMGYFKSAQPGRKLNVAASIKATVRQGGIPTCDFYKRARIRTLLILEDANAEALDWNPVSKELDAGMRRYGVPVIYGQFHGSPEIFRTPDGHAYHLEDLEDQRRGILALLFTDGKSFFRPHHAFALEAITRWPMIAWMELRERRFWDETLNLPLKYKIPIYPATRDGLLDAVRSFLTERGVQSSLCIGSAASAGQSFALKQRLLCTPEEGELEGVLGDALPWLQDCAMIQPVTEGLADALRRRFHPQLPPEQIECLYALPNTTQTEAGLRFSDEVLKVLRRGFLDRRTDAEQQKVLQFLLEEVQQAEPDVKADSLAYLSYEAVRERVRMELGAEDELQRFGELLQTPLAKSLGDSLANYGFSDQREKIPLRTKPESKKALQRLRQVNRNSLGIEPLLSWGHWIISGLLVAALVMSLGWTLKSYLDPLASAPNPVFLGLKTAPFRLDIKENDQWNISGNFAEGDLAANFFLREGQYRIIAYGNGCRTIKEFEIRKDQQTTLTLVRHDVERDCVEEYADIGLIVQNCSEEEPRNIQNTQNTRKIMTWVERLGDQ